MTGVEAHGCGGQPMDGAAPVSSKPERNPFRDWARARVAVLRAMRAPTVAQIEEAQGLEEYLNLPTEQKATKGTKR